MTRLSVTSESTHKYPPLSMRIKHSFWMILPLLELVRKVVEYLLPRSLPLLLTPSSYSTQQCENNASTGSSIDSAPPKGGCDDQSFWWCTSGRLLLLLVKHANYPEKARTNISEFFITSIAPYLGPQSIPYPSRMWHSFMTDDGVPIELSWEWDAPPSRPKVRFSIEPFAFSDETSTTVDSENTGNTFLESIIKCLPDADFQWFDHFSTYFLASTTSREGEEGHQSEMFYAFDLGHDVIMGKAYFFPAFLARRLEKRTFDVVTDAIKAAPQCFPSRLKALEVLDKFLKEATPSMRVEMFSIDLIAPKDARMKVYFRSKATHFASVVETLMLNGLHVGENMTEGIRQLQVLWNQLFDYPGEASLPHVEHRTAGILYYADFRLGDALPKIKVYLPVRHYSSSDRKVMRAMETFLQSQGQGVFAGEYSSAISKAFDIDELAMSTGVHTYIGCSIMSSGRLRLTSYLNPQCKKMIGWQP